MSCCESHLGREFKAVIVSFVDISVNGIEECFDGALQVTVALLLG